MLIVARKFPQLSLLDVENVPEVREEKKKESFIKKQIERKAENARKERQKEWKPIFERLKDAQMSFRRYVGRIERMVMNETMRVRKMTRHSTKIGVEKEDLRTLINDGVFASEQNNLELAEKKYIAAIRIDPKNAEAYSGLGDVYRKQGQIAEAEETYKFALQLHHSDEGLIMKLAELCEEEGKTEDAIQYYEQAVLLNDSISSRFAKLAELLSSIGQYSTAFEAIKQALDLEPQNSKYLDMMIEISIIVGNKAYAEQAYHNLRMANPENQKLPVLKDKIDKMPP